MIVLTKVATSYIKKEENMRMQPFNRILFHKSKEPLTRCTPVNRRTTDVLWSEVLRNMDVDYLICIVTSEKEVHSHPSCKSH